jgi:acyl carrier protein
MNINLEQTTIDTLSNYIKNVKKQDKEVKLDSHLINDLDIDSLDTIELAFLLEEGYGVSIDIDKIMQVQVYTVSELVEFIKNNCNVKDIQ